MGIKHNQIKRFILLFCIGVAFLGSFKKDLKKAQENMFSDSEKSLSLLLEILREYPDESGIDEVNYRAGLLYLKMNKPEEAKNEFESLLTFEKQSKWITGCRIELSGMRVLIDPLAVEKDLLEYRLSMKDSLILSRLMYFLGESYFYQHRWTEAITAYSAVENPDPGLYRSFNHHLGVCYYRIGQLDTALKYYESAVSLSPENSSIKIELARIYMKKSMTAQMLDSLQQVLVANKTKTTDELLSDFINSEISDQMILASIEQLNRSEIKFYFEIEYTRRLITAGELELARYKLDVLKHDYPDLIKNINDLESELDEIKSICTRCIGILIPLSGNMSAIGQSIYRGAQLAIEMRHERFPDTDYKLIAKDTREDSELSITMFKELAEREKVIGIIGPVRSASTSSIVPLSETYRIPVLTPGCPNQEILADSHYVFRLFPDSNREAEIAIRFAVEILGLRRFACLYPEVEYGFQAYRSCVAAMGANQAELVYEHSYPSGSTSFPGVFSSLKACQPEVIMILDEGEHAGYIATEIRYHELLKPILMGLGVWETPLLLKIGASSLEGSYFVSEYPMVSESRKMVIAAFQTKYGETPDGFALRSYEATELLMEGLSQGTKLREQLAFYLAHNDSLNGVDGSAHFNASQTYQPEPSICKIVKKQIIHHAVLNNNQFRIFIPVAPDPTELPSTDITDQVIEPNIVIQ